ncbi:MAG: signal peptidase I, partial [Leucobacter sp.]
TNGDVIVFTTDDELWHTEPEPEGSDLLSSAKHAVKRVFGDILGIGPTTGHTLVKRVIAVEGQTVSCCDGSGRVLVDGAALEEPYVYDDLPFAPGALDCDSLPVSTRCFGEVTVPEGMMLVLGDHRAMSSDGIAECRGSPEADADCVRWVRREDVVGEVFSVVWPLNRFGGLP